MKVVVRPLLAAVAFLIAVLVPSSAIAEPPGISDPSDGTSRNASGVFGAGRTLHGEPDTKTGAMSYAYGFELPAARGLVEPSLALTYSSSSMDGEAGYGWSLSICL